MSDPITKLVLELSKLPGIGEKTAVRLSYHVLRSPIEDVKNLASALVAAKEKIQLCEQCFTFTELSPCATCSDPRRNTQLLCVVEKPSDVMAIENSSRFHGLYHVLHGVLSPLEGVGPDQLRVRELIERAQNSKEVILALNPSVEGETTSVYLTKLLKPLGVAVSKIAHGIPVGGILEYVDRQTIGRALENRIASI